MWHEDVAPSHLRDLRAVTDPDVLTAAGVGLLPGLLGVEVRSWSVGAVTAALRLRPELFAPHGFVHGATQVALADSTCGYGAVTCLPPGAQSFATVELSANLVGTAHGGALHCTARRVHDGRSTQVWDATVTDDDGRTTCLFRCTQLVQWPR